MGQGGQRSSSKGKRMRKFQEIREAANAAQQAAIAIAKKEKGEKPKNKQDENVLKKVGSAMKKVASPVTNRLTRAGRAGIAQKKIDKHNTKVSQQDTIKKANDAGKSAFGFTRKQRAANAQKKLDKIAKKKAQQDTINRAKNLKKGVTAGMTYESTLEAKQTHMFDNEKDARAKAKEIGGKYVKGTGKSSGKHAAVKESAFTKKAVETGKVKTGASKSRIAALQKQDDNRPTLRKNEGKKMDPAAMKRAMDAFKKRGGKIKKVAPGKAAGYHGKEDPGADVQGMMDRGDTKGFNRKKKVKSMGK